MSHKSPDSVINVKVEFGEGDNKISLDAIAERAKKYQSKPKITYKMIQEYVEQKYGFKVHTSYIAEVKRSLGLTMYDVDENIYQIAEQIVQLHQKAYEVYLPLVEDVCSRTVSEDELSHLLDYLLDFACDEKILGLYKRVCRKYLDVYPGCIRDYIEAYREMWEDEGKLANDL